MVIKKRKEAINHKYDIREVFYIDLKGFENFRFLSYENCFKFYVDCVNNGTIKEA
jgi:hypothetical protein